MTKFQIIKGGLGETDPRLPHRKGYTPPALVPIDTDELMVYNIETRRAVPISGPGIVVRDYLVLEDMAVEMQLEG